MSVSIHEAITKQIIAALESKQIPWCKPWNAIPRNAFSQKRYRGINILLLWQSDYESPEWLTFNQARAHNLRIKKDSHATRIVFTDSFEKEVDGEKKTIKFLKSWSVFNAEQVEGYEPKPPEACTGDIFLSAIPAKVQHGGNVAGYSPGEDVIVLPHSATFRTYHHYLATRAHESIHWTSRADRCNRPLDRFGTESYAFEELIAELGAAFLCGELCITGQLRHAEYIASWITLLKDHNRAIISAASLASRAVDYLKEVVNGTCGELQGGQSESHHARPREAIRCEEG